MLATRILQEKLMKRALVFPWPLALLLFSGLGYATIFGNIRGVVHDPQHRPVQGAGVAIQARTSVWSRAAQTDVNGEFQFQAVPLGDYTVRVNAPGFQSLEQGIEVKAGSAPVMHFQLAL